MAGRMGSFGATLAATTLMAAMVSLAGCGAKTRTDGGAASGGKAEGGRNDTASHSALTRSDAKVHIRLHNLDSLPLENVFVQWPADSARFPSLSALGYTDYVVLEKAYRYAYIKAQGGGRTWICQPVDFVGETLLGPGRYTYEISRAGVMEESATGFLRLEMREEGRTEVRTDKDQP